MSLPLRGSMVALVTPFRNDRVDEPALKRLVEMHVKAGTSCLVPCGTTGESATLTFEEHDRVIELVVQLSRGRIGVMAGTGSNCTREAIRLTDHARRAGADGALLISPYYNKPTQQGLYLHFKAIAEAVDLPLVVYNIQSRTAVNIEPATFERLSSIQNIVAVKESSGNLAQMKEILRVTRGKMALISGDDALTYEVLSIGGTGVISVAANILPKETAQLVAAFEAGRRQDALKIQQQLAAVTKALFLETNPIPVKTAMGMLGMIQPELRLPLCEMSDANEAKLREALIAYGLLKAAKKARKTR